jgi:hypothetical protein
LPKKFGIDIFVGEALFVSDIMGQAIGNQKREEKRACLMPKFGA